MDLQGGKRYGAQKEKQLVTLRERNEKFVTDGTYEGVDDLEEKV